MKKLLMGLSLVALLAGCASRDHDNGMGGSSDQYNKTDQYNNHNNNTPNDQYNNNATHGTGADMATNSATGSGM